MEFRASTGSAPGGGAATGAWQPFEASLNPVTNIPMDKLTYYETPGSFFIVSTNRKKEHYRLIKFAKDDNGLNAFVDQTVYTKRELDDVVDALLSNKPLLNTGKARAVIGFVRFTKGFHIILVTKREQVGRIGPHRVYEVRETAMFSLCEPDPKGLLGRRQEEETYRDLFKTFDLKRYFYYSHSYDLSNTLQYNMTSRHARRSVRKKFVWNEQLLEPMLLEAACSSGKSDASGGSGQERESSSSPLMLQAPNVEEFGAWAPWIVRMIHGCFVQAPIELATKSYTLTLVGKSSVNFAGARYLKRGVNSLGHVANHVEVEQILIELGGLSDYETRGRFASFVQVRGSVPVHWCHPMVNRPKPPISLHGSDVNFEATKLHFQELMSDLGAPVVILNFLKSREGKTSREGVLTSEYVKAVAAITKDMDPDDVKIKYVAYDLRNNAHRAWNSLMSISEQHIDPIGFFATDERRVRLQSGVARSNCVDCIDRTNLGQFFIGLNTLASMMVAVGALRTPTELAVLPDCMSLLLNMYLTLGDAIAIQYGGSAQVGAGVLDRGIGWDKIMGIQRLYNNFIVDKDKQAVTNLFLRLYEPCPTTCQKGRQMVLPAYTQQENAIGNFFRFGAKKEPVPVDPRRVADLGAIDSDYYLHVPKAPVLYIEFPKRWWEAPLADFYNRCDLTSITRIRADSRVATVAAVNDEGFIRSVTHTDLLEDQRSCWYAWRDKAIVDSETDDEVEQPLGNVHLDHIPFIGESDVMDGFRCSWLRQFPCPIALVAPDSKLCDSDDDQEHRHQGADDGELAEVSSRANTATPNPFLLNPSNCRSSLTCANAGSEPRGVAEPFYVCEVEQPHYSYLPLHEGEYERVHDPQMYPYDVLNSLYMRELRELAEFEHRTSGTSEAVLVSSLVTLGDPREWTHETVVHAMQVMNVGGWLDRAIFGIEHTKLNMASLMRMRKDVLEKTFDYGEFTYSGARSHASTFLGGGWQRMGQEVPGLHAMHAQHAHAMAGEQVSVAQAVRTFVERVVRYYPFTDENALMAYIAAGNTEVEALDFERPSISFAPSICKALEPLTVVSLHPSMVENTYRFWLGVMLDVDTGIRLKTKVRFVEGGSGMIPPHVILTDVAFAGDIKRFVIDNSKRMRLKIHLQRTDAARMQMATAFLRLFVVGGLLRCVDVQIEARQRGVVVLASRPEDIEDNSRLFSFVHAERRVVLNSKKVEPLRSPRGTGGASNPQSASSLSRAASSRGFLGPPSSPKLPKQLQFDEDTAHAVHMAEAFASFCFAQLRTFMEDMAGGSTAGQHGEGPQLILDNIRELTMNLSRADLTLLGGVGRKCFFINIFNCLYIHSWIFATTQDSVTNFVVMYQTHMYNIGGCYFSLADIKHGILRRNACAPRMMLPQFSRDDKRLPLMIDADDGNYRILMALIDGYVAPDNLYEVAQYNVETEEGDNGSMVNIVYNPNGEQQHRLVSNNSFALQVSAPAAGPAASSVPPSILPLATRGGGGSSSSTATTPMSSVASRMSGLHGAGTATTPTAASAVAAATSAAGASSSSAAASTPAASVTSRAAASTPKEFDDFDMIEYVSESDDDGESPPISPSNAQRGAGGGSSGGAAGGGVSGRSNILNWLMGGKSKSTAVVHNCEPMLPDSVDQRLVDIETSFLAQLQDVASPSFTTPSGGPYPKLCQAFIGTDEFGRTPDEVVKTFQRIWRSSRRKYAMASSSAIDREGSLYRAGSVGNLLGPATPYASPRLPRNRNL